MDGQSVRQPSGFSFLVRQRALAEDRRNPCRTAIPTSSVAAARALCPAPGDGCGYPRRRGVFRRPQKVVQHESPPFGSVHRVTIGAHLARSEVPANPALVSSGCRGPGKPGVESLPTRHLLKRQRQPIPCRAGPTRHAAVASQNKLWPLMLPEMLLSRHATRS